MRNTSESSPRRAELELDEFRAQATEYSYASSLPPSKFEQCVSVLVDDLFNNCHSEQAGFVDMERIFGTLLGLLRGFCQLPNWE